MPTPRLLNLTPVAVSIHPSRIYVQHSQHAFGNLDDAVAYATAGAFTHVEAHDVRTGEKFYLAVAS